MATIFEEIMCIVSNDTGLIGLGNIGENYIDHANKHPIFKGMPSILYDGNNIWALFSDIDEITSRSMTEFDSINKPFLKN